MALNSVQSDFISHQQDIAARMIALRAEMQGMLELYNATGWGTDIVDEAVQERFPYLTAEKVKTGIYTFEQIVNHLGDTNALYGNLLRLSNRS